MKIYIHQIQWNSVQTEQMELHEIKINYSESSIKCNYRQL